MTGRTDLIEDVPLPEDGAALARTKGSRRLRRQRALVVVTCVLVVGLIAAALLSTKTDRDQGLATSGSVLPAIENTPGSILGTTSTSSTLPDPSVDTNSSTQRTCTYPPPGGGPATETASSIATAKIVNEELQLTSPATSWGRCTQVMVRGEINGYNFFLNYNYFDSHYVENFRANKPNVRVLENLPANIAGAVSRADGGEEVEMTVLRAGEPAVGVDFRLHWGVYPPVPGPTPVPFTDEQLQKLAVRLIQYGPPLNTRDANSAATNDLQERAEAGCADAAGDDKLVAAYLTTVAVAIEWSANKPGDSPALELSRRPFDEVLTYCYIDGLIPKGPPPGLNGEESPSFDRRLVFVFGDGRQILVMAGHQSTFYPNEPWSPPPWPPPGR